MWFSMVWKASSVVAGDSPARRYVPSAASMYRMRAGPIITRIHTGLAQ